MKRKKILLVEDSTLPRTVAKHLLEQLNCFVDVAITGEESILLCQKNHYDLIFMDIGLPGIDGMMAAQLIREQEKPEDHVPIIALSANSDLVTKSKALAADMDDYIIKPFTLPLAHYVLDKYVNKKNLIHRFKSKKERHQRK